MATKSKKTKTTTKSTVKKTDTRKSAPDVGFVGSMSYSPDVKATEQLGAFSRNEWVFGAASVKADVIAAAFEGLKLYSGTGQNKKEIENHPAIEMLQNPNEIMTGVDLFELLSILGELGGEWFAYVDMKAKKMYSLRPDKTTIIPGCDGVKLVDGYKYIARNGKTKTFLPEEVLHFRLPNPLNEARGLSPLKATAETFDADYKAAQWNRLFFDNSAQPANALSIPKKLDDDQYKRLKKEIDKKYSGQKNAHKMMLLENGADIKELSKTQKDMDFVALGEMAQNRILSAFRVPKAMLGQAADFNRANIYGIEYIFAKYSILPRLRKIQAILNYKFLPMFRSESNNDGKVYFEFENPVPRDEEFALKKDQAHFNMAALKPNEVRAKEGKESVPGGDETFLPFSLTTLKSAATEEEPVEETEEEKEKAALNAKVKTMNTKIVLGAYLRRFDKREKSFKSEMKKLFKKQETEVMKKFEKLPADRFEKAIKQYAEVLGGFCKKYEKEDISGMKEHEHEIQEGFDQKFKDITAEIFDKGEWEKIFITIATPIIKETLESEGQMALDELDVGVEFQTDSPAIRRVIAKQSVRFARDVNKTTIKSIRRAVQMGVANGEGQDEIAKRIRETFNIASKSRSQTIARTETLRASNSGHLKAYEQIGAAKKGWLSADDSRARPTHAKANGQEVDIDKKFTVGKSKLLHPGDLNGSADETINCRCRMIPVLDE